MVGNRRPDILLIISDDHRWCDAASLGNSDVHMPNLDSLAAQGMRWDRYSTPAPMCAPARMALYSGIYPVRNGGWPNHSVAYDGTLSMVHHFRNLDYRVGLHGKEHIGPRTVFPFDKVDDVAEYVKQDADQPYCLVVATREPHTPWGEIDQEHYDPSLLALMENQLDTPGTRTDLARYYSDLTRLDDRIGEYMKIVDDSGRADNTIVIYTSDHGAQFPGCKWTCYESGLLVPFVIRWPARVEPNRVGSALTQHVDTIPTLIEAAGGDPDAIDTGRTGGSGGDGFDGRSFLQILLGNEDHHRDHVYGVQTQHCTINGVPYPVRSVCDGRMKYITNLCHEETYSNAITAPFPSNHGSTAWDEWVGAAKDDERAAFLVNRYLHRPPVELYDLETDPFELNNLAHDPRYSDAQARLAAALAEWMMQQGDEGIPTEMAAPDRLLKARTRK